MYVNIYIHIYLYISIYLYIYIYIYIYIYVCVYICKNVYIYIYIYVCVYICQNVYMYIYRYVYLCIYICKYMCVTRLTHTCHLTHACVTWLIHVWHDSVMSGMTHSCVRWLVHMWHDSFTSEMTHFHHVQWYVTWLIHVCDMTHSRCDMTHSRVKWLTFIMCNVAHEPRHTYECVLSHIRLSHFIHVTWLVHDSFMRDMTHFQSERNITHRVGRKRLSACSRLTLLRSVMALFVIMSPMLLTAGSTK